METEFLTAEEVAIYLRLPLSTVYKLVQEKRLPGFKVGKHWRFRLESIRGWIRIQESQNYPNNNQPQNDTGNFSDEN